MDLSCELGVPPGLTTRRPESGDPSEGAPPSRPASGFNCAGIQWAPAVPQLTAKLFGSGQETRVPSPPLICSPSWAHPKGPEAARIPWSSSKLADASQSWRGPSSPPQCLRPMNIRFPRGSCPVGQTSLPFLRCKTRSFIEPSPWGHHIPWQYQRRSCVPWPWGPGSALGLGRNQTTLLSVLDASGYSVWPKQ